MKGVGSLSSKRVRKDSHLSSSGLHFFFFLFPEWNFPSLSVPVGPKMAPNKIAMGSLSDGQSHWPWRSYRHLGPYHI